MALRVKNLPANTGDIRVMGLIPGVERSLGGGLGNPLLYSCLENPMDRGAWQATVWGLQRVGHDWNDVPHLAHWSFSYTHYVWKKQRQKPGLMSCCLTHFPNKSANLTVFQNECLSPFFTLSSEPEMEHHLSLIPFPRETNKQTKNVFHKVSTHGTQVQFISSNSLVNGSW